MTTETVVLLFLGLFTKHLIVDFPLQVRFQYSNKGTYGHIGGIIHSLLHVVGTFLVFIFVANPLYALTLALVDGIVHYHVDWAKMNLNQKLGWGPLTHEQFWWLLGLDQYLHTLTYIGLIWILI